MKYKNIIKEVEVETGKKVTQQKADFAVNSLVSLGNNAKAARDSGYEGDNSDVRGHQLSNDPQVQLLVEKLKHEVGDVNDIDVKELVTQTLINEMMTADAPRDRINAAVNLGKTEGMFKDVQEYTNSDTRSTEQMLDDIEKRFGIVARKNAENQLGLA